MVWCSVVVECSGRDPVCSAVVPCSEGVAGGGRPLRKSFKAIPSFPCYLQFFKGSFPLV
jgi:hypothetical protein